MTKAPDTYTPGRPDVSEHVHVTYEGTTKIYSPSATSPGASSYTEFSCGHTSHPDYASAERCVERRAATRTRMLNQEAALRQAAQPCVYAIHEDRTWHDEPVHYMRICTSHHRIDEHLHRFHAVAAASTWECPWQPLAGVAADPVTA